MSSVNFTDNSDEVLSSMSKGIHNALVSIGMAAEGHAKEETPVDTGRLRNSISSAVINNEQAVIIGTNTSYGKYVEFGSPTNVPQHMLKKAATNHTDEYKALAKNALENA